MKAYRLVLALLLVGSCVNKSKEGLTLSATPPQFYVQKSHASFRVENGILLLNNQKFSGFIYLLAANGRDTLLVEGYVQGLKNGRSKQWNNAKLIEVRYFLNGKKDGQQLMYWENGKRKLEFMAKEDFCEGELREWNSNGQLIHFANFKKGQESGTQKMWYDNGKIRANYVIIEGKRYGLLGTKNCINVSDSIFSVD